MYTTKLYSSDHLLSAVKLVAEGAGARGQSPLCVGPPGPAALPNIVEFTPGWPSKRVQSENRKKS